MNKKKSNLGSRLALSTAMAGILFAGYGGRSAYAGTCVGAAGTYACSDPANSATDITQNITSPGAFVLTVTTNAGFGIDTSVSGDHALGLYNGNGSGDLLFTDANASPITGQASGVFANNDGDGNTSITTTGIVTGLGGAGVSATNILGSINLTIDAQNGVTGYTDAVYAGNFGSNYGSTSVTTSGPVLATTRNGVNVWNYIYTTDVTVLATGTVTGQRHGVNTLNNGVGETTITSTGVVVAVDEIGIFATQRMYRGGLPSSGLSISRTKGAGNQIQGSHPGGGPGTNLTITTQNNVTGGYGGVSAFNQGSGTTTVTNTASITGTDDFGIAVFGTGTDLTIDSQGPVTGGTVGMVAYNGGTGATSISTAAVTGTSGYGIYAVNAPTTTTSTITIGGDVTGGTAGLNALHYGSGDLQITASAAIRGGSGYAVNTQTVSGDNSIIDLNAGAVVSATSAMAIQNDEGDSAITVATGASVIGSISLGDGSDDLTFSGGDFSGVTTFDGGDDADVADGFIDTLTFAGSSGTLVAADVINWENIVVEAGSTITFDGIENLITPSLSNAGGVNTQDGAVGDTLTLSGNFTGGGTISLDAVADDGAGGADMFVIQGDVSGATVLDIANVGGTGALTTGDGILVVQVDGASPADGFTMAPFTAGEFDYTLVQVGSDWYLQSTLLTYPITEVASPPAGGSVSCAPNPVDYDGSASCTATTNTGYTFVDWSGDCTGAAACDLSNVTAAQSVTANFALNSYPIIEIASPPAGGSVSCAPNPVDHGSSASCTATAATGYDFVDWSGDCTGAAACDLSNVTAAQSVTANFNLTSYPITEIANPVAGGSVSCTPNPVDYDGSASCTATAAAGYDFVDWSGDCTGAAACDLSNVTAAQSVTANFALNSYPITEIASPVAGGSVSCTPNPVDYDGSASCTATAATGYTFVDWSGDCTGAAACDLSNVTAAPSVTANFTMTILEPVAIPTIGQWGTGILALLLGGLGWRRIQRRVA